MLRAKRLNHAWKISYFRSSGAHFRVTRYIQGNGIHRKGRRREGEEEEEGQRTARNWSVSAANEIKRGGSVYSKVSVSLPQVQKQQEIQLSDRGRETSPYYTVIIANKIRTIIVPCKKKRKNSKSHVQLSLNKSLLHYSLKRKKKKEKYHRRTWKHVYSEHIARIVAIDKNAISFNDSSLVTLLFLSKLQRNELRIIPYARRRSKNRAARKRKKEKERERDIRSVRNNNTGAHVQARSMK